MDLTILSQLGTPPLKKRWTKTRWPIVPRRPIYHNTLKLLFSKFRRLSEKDREGKERERRKQRGKEITKKETETEKILFSQDNATSLNFPIKSRLK